MLCMKEKNCGHLRYRFTVLASKITMLFFIFLFIQVGAKSAYSQEFLIYPFSTVEIRSYMLELYAEGKFSKRDVSMELEQSANQNKFLIKSKSIDDGTFLAITPETNDGFQFPSRSAWSFLFDNNDTLIEVKYYLQDNIYLIAKPYYSSTEFSLFVENQFVYENVNIPLSIKSFITMPFREFVEETRQSLYWEWIFTTKELMHVNERSRNLVSYLNTVLQEERKARVDNILDLDTMTYLSEVDMMLDNKMEEEHVHIQNNINAILNYIDSKAVDESQFTPYNDDGRPIVRHENRYVEQYITNLQNFLHFFPDFYTSISTLTTPLYYGIKNQVATLYAELFFTTAKYPGLWYIVPIIQETKVGEKTIRNYVAMEILIPYFSAYGKFEIFGYDLLTQYLKDEQQAKAGSKKYYYEIEIFRVPNKRLQRLEIH